MNSELIEALGGNKAVADELAVAPNVVANWKLEGRDIPWSRRFQIAQLAKRKKVKLPEGFFGEGA